MSHLHLVEVRGGHVDDAKAAAAVALLDEPLGKAGAGERDQDAAVGRASCRGDAVESEASLILVDHLQRTCIMCMCAHEASLTLR